MEEETKKKMIEKVRSSVKDRWKNMDPLEKLMHQQRISEGMRRYWQNLTPEQRAKRKNWNGKGQRPQ